MVQEFVRTLIGIPPEGYELYEYLFCFITGMFVIKYLLQMFKIPMMFLPRK